MPILPARGVLLRGVYARRPSTAALNRRHAEGCIPARVGPHTAAAFFHYNAVPARALARQAGVAQLVEQLTCNEKVEGSIPFTGTKRIQQKAQPSGWAFCFSTAVCGPWLQPSGGSMLNKRTMIRPTTDTIDCTTEIVLVASPIVMPKDSFTIQKPAWLA